MSMSTMLREARRHAGLSQRALADRGRTSQPAIVRYESGKVIPRADTLERLLAACGRPLTATPTSGLRPLLGPIGYRLAANRDAVLAAAADAGATQVRVFGSVARGEDTDTSDLDLLVDLEPGRTLLDIAGLAEELTELLGVPVDVGTPSIMRRDVLNRALAEAREL